VTRRLVGVLYGLAAVATFALGATVAERALWSGRVLPGVRLAAVHVAGKTSGRAGAAIAARAQRLEQEPIEARVHGRRFTVDPAKVNLHIDSAGTFLDVRHAGRSGNPIAVVTGTFLRRIRPDRVEWEVRYDPVRLDQVVARWGDAIGTGAVNGGIEVQGATVSPVKPRPGVALDRKAAERRIRDALREGAGDPVTLPVRTVQPKVDAGAVADAVTRARELLAAPVTVTVEGVTVTVTSESLATTLRVEPKDDHLDLKLDHSALHAALGPEVAKRETPVRNAGWAVNGDAVKVVPSQIGHLTDLDVLERGILAGTRVITVALHDVPPERDTAWAEALHITKKVSTFHTEHAPGQPRVHNIHRAADLLQDHVVLPGERFSLNGAIGERTEARGFVKAPVIYNDEFQEDVGGGVSQLATTLYNAVFFGGYKIVFHQSHSFYISRYPMGREATVSVPSPDLIFVNDSSAGILIRTAYTARSVTVTFYGDNGDRTVTAEGPNIKKTIEAGTDYLDDPTLPVGTEKEIDHAYTGYEVEVFRVITRPGQPTIRERIFTRYRVKNRKVARGTAGAATSTSTSTTRPGSGITTPTTPTTKGGPPSTTTTKRP